MHDSSDLLDPISEASVLTTCGNYKNLVVAASHLIGPLDPEAMKLAVTRTTENFPLLTSGVREVWRKGRFQHAWEPRPHLRPSLTISGIDGPVDPTNLLDALMVHLEPRLDAERDLSRDVASEFRVVRLAGDHHVLVVLTHHSVGDGDAAADVGKDILANYHEIVTGSKPDWAGYGHSLSTGHKRLVKLRKMSLRELLFGPSGQPPRLKGQTGSFFADGAHMCRIQRMSKEVLSEEESRGILKQCSAMGTSVIDRLVACCHLTLDQWDSEFETRLGTIITSIGVNIRNRYLTDNHANGFSLLYFVSEPSERERPAALARSVALRRINQFRHQTDLKLYRQFCRKTKALSVAPFSLQRKIIRFSLSRDIPSLFQVNFLGAIWPAFRNGRPTGESCLQRAGDLDVTEVHGFAYKPATPIPVRMWVYTYRNKLNLVLAWHRTESDGAEFMKLFMNNFTKFDGGS